MSSPKNNDTDTSRRGFFQDVSAGAAGVAIASALATLGAPAAVVEAQAAQAPKMEMPPWPKGTEGHKYDHLFCTKFKEKSTIPEVASPQAYFRGESHLPGVGMNMGWQQFVKPIKLEKMSHNHNVDEYLIFLGTEFPDLIGSFDGEIEIFLGKEYERHMITQATVLYIPRGFEHNPMEIRKLGKPMMLSALLLSNVFNGVYQVGGYMEYKGGTTID
jgi:hypothetical protein